jgi:zinc transport system substrate-binding protein
MIAARIITRFLIIFPCLLLLAACEPDGDATGPGGASADTPLTVAVSIPPQRWLVRHLVDDDAQIIVCLPPGSDPHTFLPSDADISRLLTADLYIRQGVAVENGAWFAALEERDSITIVNAHLGVPMIQMATDHVHAHGEACTLDDALDPHIWLSPDRLKIQARNISTALIERQPDRRAVYAERLATLQAALDQLDADIRTTLEDLPQRSFFVFHPAWGYFADDYNLRQIAIEVGGQAPSDHELTAVQQKARDLRCTTVFVQPQIDQRIAQAVADAIDGRCVELDPLAEDIAANLRRAADAFREALNAAPAETESAP